MLELPGLIDPHVHLRDPGATHKEDWGSGTAAALAGGFTQVLAMPNTQPPVTDAPSLELALASAQKLAYCDYAQYIGAGPDNVLSAPALAPRAAGLKLYLDQTYGPLRLDSMLLWGEHLKNWPHSAPIAAHAEGRTLAALILLASFYERPIHLCHVATREEILIIKAAKQRGMRVTCEVTPHHLFLSTADLPQIGAGRGEVRPRLAAPEDRQALWDNLEVIDCFASDHAPHTLTEKDGATPPPGYPGLETALPLYLTAVEQGRLSIEDIIARCYTNPRRIFNLPAQPDTRVEVDLDARRQLSAAGAFTRCAWTPFEGFPVTGCVRRVILRGREVYTDGRLTAPSGSGRPLRPA